MSNPLLKRRLYFSFSILCCSLPEQKPFRLFFSMKHLREKKLKHSLHSIKKYFQSTVNSFSYQLWTGTQMQPQWTFVFKSETSKIEHIHTASHNYDTATIDLSSNKIMLRRLHTVSWKVENTRFRSKILYIDILLEEWN